MRSGDRPREHDGNIGRPDPSDEEKPQVTGPRAARSRAPCKTVAKATVVRIHYPPLTSCSARDLGKTRSGPILVGPVTGRTIVYVACAPAAHR